MAIGPAAPGLLFRARRWQMNENGAEITNGRELDETVDETQSSRNKTAESKFHSGGYRGSTGGRVVGVDGP